MKKNIIPQPLLSFVPLVHSLGAILGKDCEVILHDASKPERSIIACANAHVSGRDVGSPMTDYGLEMLRSSKFKELSGVYNYLAKTPDGRVLKCGTHFIKNDSNKIIGILCINADTTKIQTARDILNELLVFTNIKATNGQFREQFAKEAEDVIASSLENIKKSYSEPLSELSRTNRMNVIEELESKGFFLIKGAIEHLAKEMKKSKFTIYGYIRELHMKNKLDSNAK